MGDAHCSWSLVVSGILAVSGVIACTSPPPAPEDLARELPPEQQLSRAQQDRVRLESGKALQELEAGHYAAARDRAQEVLDMDPRSVRARAVLGRSLGVLALAKEPPDQAMAAAAEGHLLLALRLAPEDPKARLFLAQLFAEQGHLSRASQELDLLLAGQPDDQAALRAAADVRYEMGEERAAAPMLSRLLAEVPGDAWALYRLANCQVELAEAHFRGDSDLGAKEDRVRVAVEVFQQAAKTFVAYQGSAPSDPAGYLGEAHARYRALIATGRNKDKEEAAQRSAATAIVALFQKARGLDPQNPQTFHGEGAVFDFLEDRERARASYEAALRLDANYVPSLLNLAALLHEGGDDSQKQKAKDLWRRALDLDITAGEKREIRKLLQEKEK